MIIAPLALAALSAVALLGALRAAEPSAPAPTPPPATVPAQSPSAVTEAMIRARQAERIKAKTSAKPTPATTPTPAKSETGAPAHLAAPTSAELAQSKTEAPEVLPKVEVRRSRTTEIELEVFKQEKDLAREKAKIKSTDTDRALNSSAGKALSIFGGQTTTQRETVAKERVSLMESERDLMEAIAYAKTKEEKDALRKELNEIKALRRDLESALR